MSSAVKTNADLRRMYASEQARYDTLGVERWKHQPPTSEELQRVDQICEDCDTHLTVTPHLVYSNPAQHDFIQDLWVHRFDDCATELDTNSVGDLLFIARCFLVCAESPNIHHLVELGHLHELYARVQLLGTNHTRRRFDEEDAASDVEDLEKRVACMVALHMQMDPDELLEQLGSGPLPALDVVLAAKLAPLRRVPDPRQLTEAELKEAADEAKAAAAQLRRDNKDVEVDDLIQPGEIDPTADYDINEGNYWHSDKHSIVNGFVRLASRVFRNYWLQREVFKKFRVCEAADVPVYSELHAACFRKWLQQTCKINASDDSAKRFRSLVFEHWAPMGSRQELLRFLKTKHDVLDALNLVEHQLGVDSASSLANMTRDKSAVIAANDKHDTFDFLCLAQFGNHMKHFLQCDFLSLYFILPGDLCRNYKRLEETTTWQKPRRPIVVRLLRRWWLHTIIRGEGRWIHCKDMQDVLLKLLALWKRDFDSQLANRVPLDGWIEQLTMDKSDDGY